MIDILAFGAHPDDVELACAGTLLRHIRDGKQVGIVDLTRGELGTRGSSEIRAEEAAAAAQILGISVRDNLELADGFFENNKENQLKVVKSLREYKPQVVLAPAAHDRHPDHGRASQLISDACFFSGLVKIDTGQEPWRPAAIYHYVQDRYVNPDLIVDITEMVDKKMEAIMAYKSQFYQPDGKSGEPETPISSPEFLEYVQARHSHFGRLIGVRYAEGFKVERSIGVKSFFDLT